MTRRNDATASMTIKANYETEKGRELPMMKKSASGIVPDALES